MGKLRVWVSVSQIIALFMPAQGQGKVEICLISVGLHSLKSSSSGAGIGLSRQSAGLVCTKPWVPPQHHRNLDVEVHTCNLST